MNSKLPSTPALFVPQTIFASNNQAILMGVLNKGDLTLAMTTSVGGKFYKLTDIQLSNQHPKSVKLENGETKIIGIILANLTTEEAQKIVNQELIFK